MNDKEGYTVQDFLADPAFKLWILHGKEHDVWTRFMHEHPHKAPAIKEAKELILTLATFTQQSSPQTQEDAWRNISVELTRSRNKKSHFKQKRRFYLYSAATILILLTFGLLLFNHSNKPVGVDKVYHSVSGQEKLITLPDSSTILLIGKSTLRYSGSWRDDHREVFIDGNAFFQVKHKQDAQPFLVQTSSEGTIEVIGTSFSVNATTEQILVHLEEGIIRFAYDGKQVTLAPGESISLSREHKVLKHSPNVVILWNKKEIILENAPLHAILDINKQVFGRSINLPDNVNPDQLLEGTLPIDRQEHLLEALSLLLNSQLYLEPSTQN